MLIKPAVSAGNAKSLSALLGTDRERSLEDCLQIIYVSYAENPDAPATSTVAKAQATESEQSPRSAGPLSWTNTAEMACARP